MMMSALALSDDRASALARRLLLAVVVSMLVSTSMAVGFEILSYLAFLTQPTLRHRLMSARGHPVVIGLLVFMVPIVLGAFYGSASGLESVMALFAWRRVLILPLALAVFDENSSKLLAAKVVLIVSLFGASVSILTAALELEITAKIGHGIVYQNYATQGMIISIGVAVALAALLRPYAVKGDRLLGSRRVMIGVLLFLIADIICVLPGRSGYLSLLVISAATVVLLIPGTRPMKLGAGAMLVAVLALFLVSSTLTRNRVAQALAEIANVDQENSPTSLGQRVVFLRTTARMIVDHPVFGVGTGGFLDGYRPYAQSSPGWKGQDTGDPHNQFVKILAEQGLIGLAAILYFLYSAFAYKAPAPYRHLAVAVLAGWCATSLANSHFSTFAEGRMIYFWLGAMLACRTRPSGRS